MHTLLKEFEETEEQDFQMMIGILQALKDKMRDTKQLLENLYGLESR